MYGQQMLSTARHRLAGADGSKEAWADAIAWRKSGSPKNEKKGLSGTPGGPFVVEQSIGPA